MTTLTIGEKEIKGFEKNSGMTLGSIFDGMTIEEIQWKLRKAHKDNDTNVTKTYVADAYYFDIFIGSFLLSIDEEDNDLGIKALDTEARNDLRR